MPTLESNPVALYFFPPTHLPVCPRTLSNVDVNEYVNRLGRMIRGGGLVYYVVESQKPQY